MLQTYSKKRQTLNARRERRLPASATALVRATSIVLFSVGIAKADDFNGSTTITNQTSSTGSDDTTTDIATSEPSSVTVGTGGIWDNQYNILVGDGAAGTLTIQDGGQVFSNLPPDSTTLGTYADSSIGSAYDTSNGGDTQVFSTGSVSVDGAGSMWTANSNLIVGRLGSGSLSITNGGNVTSSLGSVSDGTDPTNGYGYPGGQGTVTIDGTGSEWSIAGQMQLGVTGTGNVTVQNGGELLINTSGSATAPALEVGVENFTPELNSSDPYTSPYVGNGTLDVSGGTVDLNGGDVSIGDGHQVPGNLFGKGGNGNVIVENGGQLLHVGDLSMGLGAAGYAPGQATLTVEGTGSTVNAASLEVLSNSVFALHAGGTISISGELTLDTTNTNGVTIDGGTLTAGNTENDSSLPQTGGTTTLGDVTGTGSITLSGGSMTVGAVTQASLEVGSGGSLTVAPSTNTGQLGVLQVDSGGAVQINGGGELEVTGSTITNNSTITVGAGSSTSPAILAVSGSGDFLLTGSGTVALNGVGNAANLLAENGATLTIDANQVVAGEGEISGNINNNGTIDANMTSDTLILSSPTFSNNGTLEATNGGLLELDGMTLTAGGGGTIRTIGAGSAIVIGSNSTLDGQGTITANLINKGIITANVSGATLSLADLTITQTGGQMTAAAGSTLNISGATISGGSIGGAGTLLATGVTLDSVTIASPANLPVPDGSTTTIGTSLTNNGTVTVNPTGGTDPTVLLFTGGHASLSGTGQIVLNAAGAAAQIATDSTSTLTIGSGQSIVGQGEINATLVNGGIVNANSTGDTLAILPGSITNNATFEATAGLLDLHGLSISQGTGGLITTSAGTVNLNGATIMGGSVSSTGGTLMLSGTTLDNVTLPAANTLPVLSGTTLTLEGTFTNNGTVIVNSNQLNPAAVLEFSTAAVLSGPGTVTLNEAGASAQLNGALTQQSGSTISGEGQINAALTNAGTVDADVSGGTLTLQTSAMSNTGTMEATGGGTLDIEGITLSQGSGGQITSDNSSSVIIGSAATVAGQGAIDAELTNNGTINANISGQTLTLTADTATNNGTAEATNGGTLQLSGTTLNQGTSGVLAANSGGTVDFSGMTIVGGSLADSIGGTLNANSSTLQNVTLTANSSLNVPDSTTLTLVGTFTNNGTVNVNSNGGNDPTTLLFSGNAMLDGTGKILLQRPGAAAQINNTASGSVTIGSQQTVAGEGSISATIINDGTIDANVGSQTLTLSVNPTNNGLLEATNGGTLDLNGLTVSQGATGEVSANQATVDLIGSTISGGMLDNSNSGTLSFFALTLDNVTFTAGSSLLVPGNDTLTIAGTITNNGTIGGIGDYRGNAPIVTSTTAALDGSGTVPLRDSDLDTIGSDGSLSVGASETIHGYGTISATMTNNGTISADNGSQTLAINDTDSNVANTSNPAITNTGVIQGINGATLDFINIAVTNTSTGTLSAANSGILQFDGTNSVTGGTLTSDSTTELLNNGGSTTFDNLIISTGTTVDNTGNHGGASLFLQGTINNNGTIFGNAGFNGPAPVLATTAAILTGSGNVQLRNSSFDTTGTGSITIGSSQTIHGYGTISATMTNNGTISADNGSQTLTINDTDSNVANTSNPAITNTGVIQGINGGTLDLVNTAVTNTGTLSADTSGRFQFDGTNSVTGGTLASDSTSELQINSGITTLAGVTISTGTSLYNNGNNGAATLALEGTITNNGSIYSQGYYEGPAPITVAPNTDLVGSGEISLSRGELDPAVVGAILTQSAGHTITGQSSTINVPIDNNGTVSAPGSTLQMNAALDNTGSVDVGGTFAMDATFTQTAGNTTVDGNLQLNSGPMLLEGGILGGSGSVSGSVLNTGGTISPGDSPGILTVSGDVTQSSGGSLLIEIAGTTVGTEYDQLDINGTAALDGYLDVTTLDGYIPIYGTTFDILHAGDVQGTFADVSPGWYAVYTPTDVYLTAVPEPASGAILLACGGMLLTRRRSSERRSRCN